MTKLRKTRPGKASSVRTDRLERGVTSSQDGTDAGVEHVLRTGFFCNQRCRFCCVDLSGRRVSLKDIAASLSSIQKGPPGRNRLSISGGEPTTDPRLCDIVKLARAKGFGEIELQTNAVFLSRGALVDSLIDLGVTTFFVSFHSFEPRIYDALTGSRRQYPLALKGIENLLSRPGARTAFNIVINRLNYEALPRHVDFLHRLGRRHDRRIELFFSLMNGAGHLKAPSLSVDLRAAAVPLNAALKRCRKLGVAVEKFVGPSAPPVCLADDPAPYFSDYPVDQGDVGIYPQDFDGGRPLLRAKAAACRRCRCDKRCAGVPLEYARLHGVEALRPVAAGSSLG